MLRGSVPPSQGRNQPEFISCEFTFVFTPLGLEILPLGFSGHVYRGDPKVRAAIDSVVYADSLIGAFSGNLIGGDMGTSYAADRHRSCPSGASRVLPVPFSPFELHKRGGNNVGSGIEPSLGLLGDSEDFGLKIKY